MMHLLIPYILLVCGLFGSIALFLSMKREMHRSTARNHKRMEEISKQLEQAQARPPEPAYAPPPAPRSGMNINKRVQAMRMVRRNEDVSHIAAALGVPRKEVELLIRVQKMAAGK